MNKKNEEVPIRACRCECARCEQGAHCYNQANRCRIGERATDFATLLNEEKKYDQAKRKIMTSGGKPLEQKIITFQET